MIRHIVELTVQNATAESFYNFMITPDNEKYKSWWPEEHLQFYIVKRGDENHLGDEVLFDEYMGKRHRLAFRGVVVTVKFPHKIVWQMKKAGMRLPAYLELELCDSVDGLKIRHKLKVGYSGIGRLLDLFIGLYVNKSFIAALENHCRIEWPKLADFLNC